MLYNIFYLLHGTEEMPYFAKNNLKQIIMTKQSFPIPEGCKAVTVEQVGNQIITTFEPEFKRGDVLYRPNTTERYESIIIFDEEHGDYIDFFVGLFNGDTIQDNSHIRQCKLRRIATHEEAQRLWDALAKKGKRWNPETMKVEPIKKERWRAKNDGIYYSVDISTTRLVYYLEECGDAVDNRNYTSGNYFQTEEQAQRAADRLKAELDKFWKEELR